MTLSIDKHVPSLRMSSKVYKSDMGGQVLSGCFQLIPSSSIDRCARMR